MLPIQPAITRPRLSARLAPDKMVIKVIPTWMVDKKWLGCSNTLSRRMYLLSPSSAFCSTRERFSDTIDISVAEKKAFNNVKTINKINSSKISWLPGSSMDSFLQYIILFIIPQNMIACILLYDFLFFPSKNQDRVLILEFCTGKIIKESIEFFD